MGVERVATRALGDFLSQFGWVDQDERHRRAMLSVVQLFKDDGTIDELGTGSIRDAISNTLFPGTSVLQTRARYLVIVPWLIKKAAAASQDGREAEQRLRALESRVIYSLLRGGEPDGVIGRQAKEKLKRMPSAAYWAALGTFGIRTTDSSIGGLLRQEVSSRRQNAHAAQPDDPGAERDHVPSGIHADLPPAPDNLLSEATLALTQAEQDFLRDRILASTKGSLLAWLLGLGTTSEVAWIWQHEHRDHFPAEAEEYVDAGRRFHTLVQGAALTYNSLLAEKRAFEDLIATYDEDLEAWSAALSEADVFSGGWSADQMWSLLDRGGHRVAPGTRTFISAWLGLVAEHGGAVGHVQVARDLVRQREIALKGGRARLINDSALEQWTGRAGLVPLDYRWGVASRLIRDLTAPTEVTA